jgi:HEAT repeat protein
MQNTSVESKNEVGELLKDLGSSDPNVRNHSRLRLVAQGMPVVVPLVQLLATSPSELVRWEAAKALGEVGDIHSATALAAALDDAHQEVRWAAARSLIALGPEGLRQTLTLLLTKAGSGDVRDCARHVLGHFANLLWGQFLIPLLERFYAYEPGVAIPPAALEALHELRKAEIEHGLLSALCRHPVPGGTSWH